MNETILIKQLFVELQAFNNNILKELGKVHDEFKTDMTFLQYRACLCIKEHQPIKMSNLAKEMSMTTPGATQLIEKLVEHQMVERTDDPSDRRSILIQLSDLGQKTINDLDSFEEKMLVQHFGILEDEEINQLLTIFKKLNSNL